MNKYFITIKENRYDMYDFVIELFNADYMEEKVMLGNRENIDTLGECLEMIKSFPLSQTSELSLVEFKRRNKILKLTNVEQRFVNGLQETKLVKGIKEIKIN